MSGTSHSVTRATTRMPESRIGAVMAIRAIAVTVVPTPWPSWRVSAMVLDWTMGKIRP